MPTEGHNPETHRPTTNLPTETAPATRVNEARQQASTEPGDGPRVAQNTDANAPANANEKPLSFPEQVIGYAKVARGTMLGKSNTKDHGNAILEGRVPVQKKNTKDETMQ